MNGIIQRNLYFILLIFLIFCIIGIWFLPVGILFKLILTVVLYLLITNLMRFLPPEIPVKSFINAMVHGYKYAKMNNPMAKESDILLETLLQRSKWKKEYMSNPIKVLLLISNYDSLNELSKQVFYQEYNLYYRKLPEEKFEKAFLYIDKYINENIKRSHYE